MNGSVCLEYCDGSLATQYCPQCSAIYCDGCYQREHEGNKRKQGHQPVEKIPELCKKHGHSLEFYDLTQQNIVCLLCVKEDFPTNRYDLLCNVVDTRHKTRLRKCIDKAREKMASYHEDVLKSYEEEKDAFMSTVHICKLEITAHFEALREALAKREQELIRHLDVTSKLFLVNSPYQEVKERSTKLQAAMEQGEQLMNEEPEKVAREQPKSMACIQTAYKALIKDPGELNLPTISVEFDNTMSSLIPKHGELLEGENGLDDCCRCFCCAWFRTKMCGGGGGGGGEGRGGGEKGDDAETKSYKERSDMKPYSAFYKSLYFALK